MSVRALVPLALGSTALALLGYVALQGSTAGPGLPAVTAPVAAPDQRVQPAPQMSRAAAEAPARIDADWLARTAAKAGIPAAALRAYATAQLRIAADDDSCHLGWTTLAGIGWVESQHGTYRGRSLGEDGVPSRPILGPTLDGSGEVAAVEGDDGGWARAAGPMQFIPSTWRDWAADGDGDGVTDVQDLDDAAYAAGRYLCASGSMADGAGWAAAVLSYNHSQVYVDQVYAAAQTYAERTS